MELSQPEQAFILHWGEMGSRWGITRATAQIHAILLVSEKPLDAQKISEALQLARSNVSTGLRELQAWGVIKVVHVMGDRKEHFEADKDAWSVLAKIGDRRVEKEILPTIEALKNLQKTSRGGSKHFHSVIENFVGTLDSGVRFYRKLRDLPLAVVKRVIAVERGFDRFYGGRSKNG